MASDSQMTPNEFLILKRRTDETATGTGAPVLATSPTFNVSVLGDTSMEVFNTLSTTVSAFGAATTLTIGGTPTTAITHNYSTNATANATTKTVNVATGGAAGSTTNVNVGSANGGTTTVNSPTLAASAVTATTLAVGGGATVSKILTATVALDLPSIVNGGEHRLTGVSVPGVVVGDPVFAGLTSIFAIGWQVFPIVTAADTVAVWFLNYTGGTLNPASGTLRITCIKF